VMVGVDRLWQVGFVSWTGQSYDDGCNYGTRFLCCLCVYSDTVKTTLYCHSNLEFCVRVV
jgi:hypothetical protein